MTWFVAFVLTHAIEVPLAVALVPGRRARVAIVALLASVISHPIFTFVLLRGLPGPFVAREVAGEVCVIAIEALVWRAGMRLRWPHAIAISAVLNATSYLVGLLLLHVI